jgi:acetyl esterase/lipase
MQYLLMCTTLLSISIQILPCQTRALSVPAAISSPVVIDSLGIPRDDYFTIASATEGVLKSYPEASYAEPVVPEGVTVLGGVCYRQIGARRLSLDLCLPPHAMRGSVPAVILAHGGGWRSGDRAMEMPMALQLAGRGYVAATVEYRLSPEAMYPAAVHDLKAAVRWIRAHAQQYGVDTTKVAVYGCSSGGHLATLLGVTNSDSAYENGENAGCSSAVQAIVDVDGPVDLTDPAESSKDDDPSKPSSGKRWIGYSYTQRPDLWRAASPLTHVSSRVPPIIFINSSIERFHAGRDTMLDTLKRYGIYHEVHTLPNTPHPFWMFRPWQPEVVRYVAEFLDGVFRKQ